MTADNDSRAEAGPSSAADAVARPDGPAAGPADAAPARRLPRRHRKRKPRWWVGPLEHGIGLVVLALIALFAVLALTGRPLPAPAWAVREIEARANAALDGQATVRLGGIEAIVDDSFVPRVRMTWVQLNAPSGASIALLPDLRATFDPLALLSGRIAPRALYVTGAQVALRRLPDGRFDLPGRTAAAAEAKAGSFSAPEVLDAIDKAFEVPVLAGLGRIEVTDMSVRLSDARTGKEWSVDQGKLTLDQTGTSILMAVGLDLSGPDLRPARAEIDFASRKRSPEARIEARITGVPSADLAEQSPALAWLSALDAPISGSVRTGVDETGAIRPLSATLTIGAGALRPAAGAQPLPINAGKVALTYDPAAAVLTLTDLVLDSPALRIAGDGKARLLGAATGFPDTLVAQVRINELKADPAGLFAQPVIFSQGAADLKIDLDPFSVRIGQMVLVDQGRKISASGSFGATPEGWSVAADVAIDAIESDRLLALWPVSLVPKTRAWLKDNVATAELFDVKAAVRIRPKAAPVLSLGYEYKSASVRFLKTLPPILDGEGYATIEDFAYTLVLDKGHVVAPQGGDVDVAGSVLQVPDIRRIPAPARVSLRTDSTLTAALSLLDQPPFRFLSKAGRPVDLAEGRAKIEALLDFPLVPKVRTDQIDYLVTGKLTGVRSDKAVPGRALAADALTVRATPAGLEIEGPGTLSGVSFQALYRQGFAPESRGRSSVEGTVELSPQFLKTFRIGLPDGAVRGIGQGTIRLDVTKGAATRFRLTSDLAGLRLAIPAIGWSKPEAATGRLDVSGTLGTPPKVENLEIAAAGLSAHGSVTLRPDGTMDLAQFDRAELAGLYKGALDLKGRGKGQLPQLVLHGGTADIRKANFSGAGGGNMPMTVELDRLTISGSLALTGLKGDFSTAGGFNGRFQARVNGGTPIAGTAVPVRGGTGFRIVADDAGGVFASAGFFSRGRGGALEATLLPGGAPRVYDGTVSIKSIRVVDAPVLAELLGLISVVGLLEQLNGPGIQFADVQGAFRLTPDTLTITDGSAVGASLGVSAQGVYGLTSKRMEVTGVVSPIYLLNGIGRIFATKREGLFGFNYRLSGTSDDPQVSVNPLSILTPGMFREIFRSPPPKVEQ